MRVRSPTLDVILLVSGVFVVQQLLGGIGFGVAWVGLALPLGVRPWTVVTSVYAHGDVMHLVTNVVALGVIGLVVERVTTRARFHVFVLVTGVISGITEIVVSGFVGTSVLVLGISGAILALFGYAVTGNVVVGSVLDRLQLSRRTQLAVYLVLAVSVTVLSAGSEIAVIAHFTGFFVGLVAGRARVLHT